MQTSFLTNLHWQDFAKEDKQKIVNAYDFLFRYLAPLKKKNKSYALHGVEVALTLGEISKNPSLWVIALLHDINIHPEKQKILENAPINKEEKNILKILESLESVHLDFEADNIDKIINAFIHDTEVLIIHMAHKIADIRNFHEFDENVQKKIAKETLNIYTFLAGHLGLHTWKHEMEDICFKILYPEYARALEKQFQEYKEADFACLNLTKEFLEKKFHEAQINCIIETRIKTLYSTYKKMLSKNREFHELSDRLAVRVITENTESCYKVLGIVHNVFNHMPDKFKDYIGAPKKNGYRSIHTVIHPLPKVTTQPIEIQIRSKNIHEECESGTASHQKYKSMMYNLQHCISSVRVNLFKQLKLPENKKNLAKQISFAISNRKNGKKGNLLVFDNNNRMFYIKFPATILDFICFVHKDLVSFLEIVEVNGKEASLYQKLQDGDSVHPIFGETIHINKEWLNHCFYKSSKELLKSLL